MYSPRLMQKKARTIVAFNKQLVHLQGYIFKRFVLKNDSKALR